MTIAAHQIEGVPHLLRRQDGAGKRIADDPTDGHSCLEFNLKTSIYFNL